MSQRTDESVTTAMMHLPDSWELADPTEDESFRYQWQRPDGTRVIVWVIERDETNEASDFRLRAATHDPGSLLEHNAYEVSQYRSTESAVQSAKDFIEYLTERLENGPNKERSLHLRVANTITAFQHRGGSEKITDALRQLVSVTYS